MPPEELLAALAVATASVRNLEEKVKLRRLHYSQPTQGCKRIDRAVQNEYKGGTATRVLVWLRRMPEAPKG